MHWKFSSNFYATAVVDNMLYERLIIFFFLKLRSNTIKIKINRTFLSLSLYARSWISAFILLCLLIPLALLTFFWMFSHILLFSFTSTLYEAKVFHIYIRKKSKKNNVTTIVILKAQMIVWLTHGAATTIYDRFSR